jgi:hypothetical protein
MSEQQDQTMAGRLESTLSNDVELNLNKPSGAKLSGKESDEEKQSPSGQQPKRSSLMRLFFTFISQVAETFWPLSLWFGSKARWEQRYKDRFIETVQPCKHTLVPTYLD